MVTTVKEQSRLMLHHAAGAKTPPKQQGSTSGRSIPGLFFGPQSRVCVCQGFPSNSFSAVKTFIHFLEAALMGELKTHIFSPPVQLTLLKTNSVNWKHFDGVQISSPTRTAFTTELII